MAPAITLYALKVQDEASYHVMHRLTSTANHLVCEAFGVMLRVNLIRYSGPAGVRLRHSLPSPTLVPILRYASGAIAMSMLPDDVGTVMCVTAVGLLFLVCLSYHQPGSLVAQLCCAGLTCLAKLCIWVRNLVMRADNEAFTV